jgi:hypothetical protein
VLRVRFVSLKLFVVSRVPDGMSRRESAATPP